MSRILYAIIIICSITSHNCKGQENVLTDIRDGKTYPIVTIGNLKWFKSNLAYETPNSWCAQHGRGSNCNDGNFYYYNDLTNVCPEGWRLPSWDDIDTTVKLIMLKHNISLDSLHYKNSELNRNSVTVTGINLMNSELDLEFKATGWVQGKRKRSWRTGQANFFIIDSKTKDSTTHIHIFKTGYVKHGHDFNIIDKPRKQRRLSVRCIKDLN